MTGDRFLSTISEEATRILCTQDLYRVDSGGMLWGVKEGGMWVIERKERVRERGGRE